MGDRLATIDMGRKLGDMSLWEEGKAGPHLTQCRLGPGLPPYQWYPDASSSLVTIDMGQKLGACVPFFLGGGLSSRLTQSLGRGLPPYQVAS